MLGVNKYSHVGENKLQMVRSHFSSFGVGISMIDRKNIQGCLEYFEKDTKTKFPNISINLTRNWQTDHICGIGIEVFDSGEFREYVRQNHNIVNAVFGLFYPKVNISDFLIEIEIDKILYVGFFYFLACADEQTTRHVKINLS